MPDTAMYRKINATDQFINFIIDLLKKGIPVHPDAFALVKSGKNQFITARDPDTLAHGLACLEKNDYIPPSRWTAVLLDKIAAVDAVSRFAPAKSLRIANRNIFSNPLPPEDEIIIHSRALKTLKKIHYLVSQAEIPHANFKERILSNLKEHIQTAASKLKYAEERIQREAKRS